MAYREVCTRQKRKAGDKGSQHVQPRAMKAKKSEVAQESKRRIPTKSTYTCPPREYISTYELL